MRLPGADAEGFFQLTAGSRRGCGRVRRSWRRRGWWGGCASVDRGIAFGIDWMNPEFRASAMTIDGSVYGIVEPRAGPGGEPMLALTGTPRHVRAGGRRR